MDGVAIPLGFEKLVPRKRPRAKFARAHSPPKSPVKSFAEPRSVPAFADPSKTDGCVARPGLRERLRAVFSTPEWQRRKRIAAVLLVIWMAGAPFPPAPPPAGAG